MRAQAKEGASVLGDSTHERLAQYNEQIDTLMSQNLAIRADSAHKFAAVRPRRPPPYPALTHGLA